MKMPGKNAASLSDNAGYEKIYRYASDKVYK